MSKNYTSKSVEGAIIDISPETRTVKACWSRIGNLDLDNDIIVASAFTKTIAENELISYKSNKTMINLIKIVNECNIQEDITTQRVIELYKKGLPYKEIMLMTGLKRHHLCEIVKLTDHRRIKALSIKIVREIERMVDEKWKTCDIAKELNLDYNRVSHWVRKAKKEGVH
jgi:transposase